MTRILSVERRNRSPYGEDMLGVLNELYQQKKRERKEKKDEKGNTMNAAYIRKHDYSENNNPIIVCGQKRQTAGFHLASVLQMDMSFKGIKGTFNDWEIAIAHPVTKMTLACVRTYTDGLDHQAYYKMFTLVNELVEEDTGTPLQFAHIHGSSEDKPAIKVLIGDLDQAQLKGLGLFLERTTRTTTKMGWETHLTHMFKSCQVHFHRNVVKHAPGNSRKPLRDLMRKLLQTTPATAQNLFDHILAEGEEIGVDMQGG
ncbi:hypothetical protein DFS34DRAFT_13635 [Phlyctochytrium arcticum]|nr:hypothetical protein DFS34DRAFT_13635 [Phlyctochytrium arcticum]